MTSDYRAPAIPADRIRAGVAIQLIALATGVPADAMTERERLDPRATRARRLAMYLTHVGFGWPLERVGLAFGLNRATVGIACRWAEDARDRPAVDALFDRLEALIQDLCAAPRLDLSLLKNKA